MSFRYPMMAVVCSLAASCASAQELSAGNLTRVKDSTAYVRWEASGRLCMGSAYLFKKTATTGFLLTCAHVVEGADEVTLVFNSGMPNERSLKAIVVARDAARDSACLKVTDSNLPSALEICSKTDLRETESVFVAGFPFGEMLSTSSKNPNISVSKASVSSIRRGDRNEVVLVQLDGNINPGNSGGPVMDSKGRVVGMAAAKLKGTQTCFAVPPEELSAFLKGRVESLSLKPAGCDGKKLRLEIEARIIDPTGSLRSVGWSFIRREQIKELPVADGDGRFRKASPSMKDIALKIEGEKATGSIEFVKTAADGEGYEIAHQCYFTTSDGNTIWTEGSTHWIAFDEAALPPKPGPKPAEKPGDKPKPEALPSPPVAGTEISAGEVLKEAGRIKLMGAVGDMFLSKDGAWLYVLDLSEGQLLKIATTDFAVDSRLDLPDGTTCMAMNSKGDTLYVAWRLEPGDSYDKQGKGNVAPIPISSFKLGMPVEFPGDPIDLDVTTSGLAFVSIVEQWDGLLVVDMAKKTSDKIRLAYGGSLVHTHPDQTRLYFGSTGLSPGDYHCLPTARDMASPEPFPSYDSKYHGDYPLGGDFVITPDGTTLLGCYGTALRLSKGGRESDLLFMGKTDPWISAAVAPGCASAALATKDGFIKLVSLRSFETSKSLPCDGYCTHLALDGKTSRLYAHVSPKTGTGSSDVTPGRKLYRVGDLVAWSLK